MRTFFLFITVFVVMFCACSPEDFQGYDLSNYSVDKVVCEASSNFLTADGVAQLDLSVKIYTLTGTYTDEYGVERDRYMEVPQDRWRNHDIKYYINGTEVTPPYVTSTVSPSTLQCYAVLDGIHSSQSPAKQYALYPPLLSNRDPKPESASPVYTADPDPFFFEVTVRQAPSAIEVPPRRMPVVFHIIDLRDHVAKKQILEASVVTSMVNVLNGVFGRKYDRFPSGANPNIEFVLALKNPSGAILAEPGINRRYIEENELEAYTNDHLTWIWNLDDITEAAYNAGSMPTRTPRVYWDPDRYLNIWVYHAPRDNSGTTSVQFLPRVLPEGVYDPAEFPLPAGWTSVLREMNSTQLAQWKANPYDLRLPPTRFPDKIKTLSQVGIYMTKENIANYDFAIARQMGVFLGLIPSTAVSRTGEYLVGVGSTAWWDDLCDDTPPYDYWYGVNHPSDGVTEGGVEYSAIGSNRVKYTKVAPYFAYRSNNIMENGSSQSSVSLDQVKRMQWVLENVPGRQAWKNLTAITL